MFFPITLAVFYLIPGKWDKVRLTVLILASLLFYAWGDITSLPIFVLSILFHRFSGREIAILGKDPDGTAMRRIVFLSSCVIDVALLALFKYTKIAQPIGVSFYTFSAISYLADIYRGKAECGDFLSDVFYICFFPKLVSGPIVPYKDMKPQIAEHRVKRDDLMVGLHLFLIGLCKKVLLADNLGTAFQQIYGLDRMSGLTAWLGMIFYSLQLYFDFSGYSDMAIGLARIFGFRFEKNFDYPYMAVSVTDFWRRWHISLGAWFREYVYIPLGGNRCSQTLQIRNLAVVWLLTGIWHGNTWNYVFWGIYHGCFVILEKFVIKGKMEKVPTLLRILIVDLIAFVGWIFFFNPSLGSSFAYIGKLFGADGIGMVDRASIYYLTNNLILLAAALVGCTPLAASMQKSLVYRQGRGFKLSMAIHIVLLLFCTANMVGSTYQTFMYFQF